MTALELQSMNKVVWSEAVRCGNREHAVEFEASALGVGIRLNLCDKLPKWARQLSGATCDGEALSRDRTEWLIAGWLLAHKPARERFGREVRRAISQVIHANACDAKLRLARSALTADQALGFDQPSLILAALQSGCLASNAVTCQMVAGLIQHENVFIRGYAFRWLRECNLRPAAAALCRVLESDCDSPALLHCAWLGVIRSGTTAEFQRLLIHTDVYQGNYVRQITSLFRRLLRDDVDSALLALFESMTSISAACPKGARRLWFPLFRQLPRAADSSVARLLRDGSGPVRREIALILASEQYLREQAAFAETLAELSEYRAVLM